MAKRPRIPSSDEEDDHPSGEDLALNNNEKKKSKKKNRKLDKPDSSLTAKGKENKQVLYFYEQWSHILMRNRSPEPQAPIDGKFISAARTIARCIDLWCDVPKVIRVMQMLEQEKASDAGELEEDEAATQIRKEALSKYDKKARKYFRRTYQRILEVAPGLSHLIKDPKCAKELESMNEIINSTRSIDMTKLRTSIGQYAAPDPYKAALEPPIVNNNSRDEMGFNHPILARYICPASVLKEFIENPEETRKQLESGKKSMAANNFPAVFWSGEKYPGEDYNPEDMCDGLFRGYMLIRVARHIFIGPTAALNLASKKGSKSCNAVLHDMTTIEPEHIAYACIQTRFGISSMSTWNQTEGELCYLALYRHVVSFIRESIDVEWKEELLKWWKLQVFGNEKGRGFAENMKSSADTGASTSQDGEVDMLAKMQAQMAACVAAKAAASSVPTPPPSSEVDNDFESHSPTHTPQSVHQNKALRSGPGPSHARPSRPQHQSPEHQHHAESTPPSVVPRRPGLRSSNPSPVIPSPHRPGVRSKTPSPFIPRRFVPCGVQRNVATADEDQMDLTPLVKKTRKSTKGKKRAVDEESSHEDSEPDEDTARNGGKATKDKGKKRRVDKPVGTQAADTRGSKRRRSGK